MFPSFFRGQRCDKRWHMIPRSHGLLGKLSYLSPTAKNLGCFYVDEEVYWKTRKKSPGDISNISRLVAPPDNLGWRNPPIICNEFGSCTNLLGSKNESSGTFRWFSIRVFFCWFQEVSGNEAFKGGCQQIPFIMSREKRWEIPQMVPQLIWCSDKTLSSAQNQRLFPLHKGVKYVKCYPIYPVPYLVRIPLNYHRIEWFNRVFVSTLGKTDPRFTTRHLWPRYCFVGLGLCDSFAFDWSQGWRSPCRTHQTGTPDGCLDVLTKIIVCPVNWRHSKWEIHHFKMYLRFEMVVFHCYVSLPEGKWMNRGVLETRGLRFRRVAGRRMLIFLFRTNLCWGAGVLNLPWLIIMPYFSPSISFQSIHTTRIAVQSFQPFIFQQKNLQQKGDEKYYLWNFGSRMFGIFHATTEATVDFGLFIGWSSGGTYWPSFDHWWAWDRNHESWFARKMNGPWDSNWI